MTLSYRWVGGAGWHCHVGGWGWMALSYRWVGLEAVVQVGGWLDDAAIV